MIVYAVNRFDVRIGVWEGSLIQKLIALISSQHFCRVVFDLLS